MRTKRRWIVVGLAVGWLAIVETPAFADCDGRTRDCASREVRRERSEWCESRARNHEGKLDGLRRMHEQIERRWEAGYESTLDEPMSEWERRRRIRELDRKRNAELAKLDRHAEAIESDPRFRELCR